MTLKEMEAELTRLKAEAATHADTLKAKDGEIANLTAKDEANQKAIADLNAKLAASAEASDKLQAENKTLAQSAEKLKTDLKAAEGSGAREALKVIAESGHPAPIEGTPKSEEPRASSKLKGQALLAELFEKSITKK